MSIRHTYKVNTKSNNMFKNVNTSNSKLSESLADTITNPPTLSLHTIQSIIALNLYNTIFKKVLPLGIPQGPGVLLVSRKSRSYVRAGGNVRATWLVVLHTRQATTANINSLEFEFMMNEIAYLSYSQAHFIQPRK